MRLKENNSGRLVVKDKKPYKKFEKVAEVV